MKNSWNSFLYFSKLCSFHEFVYLAFRWLLCCVISHANSEAAMVQSKILPLHNYFVELLLLSIEWICIFKNCLFVSRNEIHIDAIEWDNREPNQAGGECLVIKAGKGKASKTPCDQQNNFICQYRGNSIIMF